MQIHIQLYIYIYNIYIYQLTISTLNLDFSNDVTPFLYLGNKMLYRVVHHFLSLLDSYHYCDYNVKQLIAICVSNYYIKKII